jgi:Uma2 family endonuclease
MLVSAAEREISMTSAIFGLGLPMTEREFLALEETNERVELFDGSLYVTPAPTPRHQVISRRLANALDTNADLQVMEAVNVKLRQGRIPIPDLVITEMVDLDELIVAAESVRLVCEIVSPSNAATDKVLKMHYYATAGIRWYLLVEPEPRTLRLFELAGDKYMERAVAHSGEVLQLTDPVEATIVLDDLLPPR